MNVLFPPFIYRELGTNEHDAINLLSELRIDFDANAECPGYPTSHMDEYCIYSHDYIISFYFIIYIFLHTKYKYINNNN